MTIRELENASVLVVEDEYFIATEIARALEEAGARAVGPAGTVEQAKALLAEQQVDAAILDLNLRGNMAVPLVEQLSKRGMPCVIVSGYGSESLPESISGVPNLEKPVNYAKVMQLLAAQLPATAE
jgi:DNA-binding NtrC family response regulator